MEKDYSYQMPPTGKQTKQSVRNSLIKTKIADQTPKASNLENNHTAKFVQNANNNSRLKGEVRGVRNAMGHHGAYVSTRA